MHSGGRHSEARIKRARRSGRAWMPRPLALRVELGALGGGHQRLAADQVQVLQRRIAAMLVAVARRLIVDQQHRGDAGRAPTTAKVGCSAATP